ncbi:type VI secretion system Vgr family protein [Polyangium mundeleinium]|uniref:Type VI secretion system tip protein TssI/VgrG n=1 Tax=Polyangium mundeleinium TaxID=2995306 RepID=A0ABT5EMS2_9BACT|nr:type VI secretion system tip protein TssI/VgrG [Polyangium mundeleinium]MDC0742488.1 type VI secretion system tip protein TssI/VgrG [Polyangium mundeleinium]
MSEIFTFLSTAFPPTAQVTAFKGREAISRTYEFDIALKLTGLDVDVAAAVGARGTLNIDRGLGAPPFVFHGILASVELVNDYGAYGLYLARLVPTYWQLTLTRHSRIFTDASIPDIIEALLKEGGLGANDYRISLWNEYTKLEHVCQYRESNYDFIARLAEREGIYFYFEQGEDHEVLVFTDTRSAHKKLAPKPVKYFPAPPGDVSAGESIRSFRCRSNALPGRVKVTDYNYLKPSLEVKGSAELSGKGDIVLYGENVKTPGEGTRYASIRAEEIAARQTVYTGTGPQFYLRPGYVFMLEEHPRLAFNSEYLTIEIEHVGNQSASGEDMVMLFGEEAPTKETYLATVHAIPHATQFRAERKTPWPRIDGVVDGVVDGTAASPYAQIDGHGRYKVNIFFDEGDAIDGSRSTWVRMLQPHGGTVEGQHFPLRKGTEVHLVFLGGDPDRPVIAGAAHNAETPSVVTQNNYTKNLIRTGSNNYIEMEDLLGSTHVHIYAPKLNSSLHLGAGAYNFDLRTDGSGHIYTGVNLDVDVMANKTEDVHGTITEMYEGPFTTTVTNPVTQTYNATLDETVEGAVTVRYNNILDLQVASTTTQVYKAVVDLNVHGTNTERFHSTYDETVHGKMTGIYLGTRFQGVTGEDKLFVDGNQDIHVTGPSVEKIDGTYDLTVKGDMTTSINGNQKISTQGPVEWFKAAEFSGFTHGATFSGHLGFSLGWFAGGQVSLFGGIKVDITAAVALALTLGPSISISPVAMDMKATNLNALGLKLQAIGNKLEAKGLSLGVAGLHVNT